MFQISKNIIKFRFIFPAVLFAAVFAFAVTPNSSANNQRVVTIHDGGKNITVTTQAVTIGEVLDRAGIDIGKHDMTEPSLDTPLISPAYTVNVYRARPVTIVDGVKQKHIMSPYHSPQSIANHAGLALYNEDIVTKERVDNFIGLPSPGLIVTVDRATPVTLVLYGKQAVVRTQAEDVAGLLREKHIELGPKDEISEPTDAPLTDGMMLDIYRDGIKTVTKEEPIPFETRTIQDADRDAGYKKVQTHGVKGKKTVTYQITLKNGKPVARKQIQSVITKQPQEEVVIVGTKYTASFEGGLAEKFAALRQCESGGNYANKNNPLYRGAYQFGFETWANNGGYHDPADAPPALQDAAALALYQRRGWSPWPACSAKLGL